MAPRDGLTTESYRIPRPASDVHDYYRHFIAAIRGEREQDVTYEQMRMDLKIILAALESAKNGLPVEIK
jgi:predicted dehydrogenase